MKPTIRIAAVLLALAASLAFAVNPSPTANRWDGQKVWTPSGVPFDGNFQTGNDISTAIAIPGLPYTDSFNSCAYADDYDEPCPWGGGAPDVVYSFTPAMKMHITIDLCESSYDTKVFVYEGSAGNLVACNDDECDGPNYPNAFLSHLECVELSGGMTYYIVVDGYGQDCGDYVLHVDECTPPTPCDAVCPAGAFVEDEPTCGTGYVDHTNGGCNSTPAVFVEVPCDGDPTWICGESGTWYDGSSYWRDTDWWAITLTETKTVRFGTCADFKVQTLLIIPDPDCGNYTYPYSASADAGVEAVIEETLGPGTYWYWVGPQSWFDIVPCGEKYVTSVQGWCSGTATEKATWGAVKRRFR